MYKDPKEEALRKLEEGENYIDKFVEFARREIVSNDEYAKNILEKGLKICNKKGDIRGIAWCTGLLGWYFNYSGIYENAAEKFLKANTLFQNISDEDGKLYAANGLMNAYFQLGLYELSTKWGKAALKIAKETRNDKFFVIILNNICVNYLKIGKYEKAKKIIGSLQDVPYGDRDDVKISMYQVIAEIECEIGSISKAMEFIGESIEIANKNNWDVMLCESLRIRGKINFKAGNYKDAELDYLRAMDMAIKGDCYEFQANILENLAQYDFLKEDYNEGINKLLRALKISEKNKCILSIRNIYNQLYLVNKQNNNYKDALKYYEKYNDINNELNCKGSECTFLDLENERSKHEAAMFKSLYDDIKVISTIGQKITSDLNFDKILENTYKEISMIMKADIVGISTFKESDKVLDYALFIDRGKRLYSQNVHVDDETSFGAYCVRNKCTILVNDIYNDYKKYIPRLKVNISPVDTQSTMYCPLTLADKVRGFLNVQSYKKNAYTDNDLNKLKILASYVAIALENSYLYNKTKYFSSHDFLTGLLSRMEIFEEGEKAFEHCTKNEEKLAVIMIDIDDFKVVNDKYGHCIGDLVLKNIGYIINEGVGNCGFAGRYGGEEFLIVLPEIDENKIYSICEHIRESIERADIYYRNKRKLKVTASIGIFIYEGKESSFEKCISFADEALYIAKAEGKNKLVRYDNYS